MALSVVLASSLAARPVPVRVSVPAAPTAPVAALPAAVPPLAGPSPVRQRLLELVHQSPGLSMSDARARLGVAWGTVAHHVRRLRDDGLLETEARGRHVALFATGMAPHHRVSAAILRDGQATDVLRLLGQVRQASMLEVGAALGASRKVARRLLRGLVAAGLVENIAAGRPRYRLVQHAGLVRPVAVAWAQPAARPFGPEPLQATA